MFATFRERTLITLKRIKTFRRLVKSKDKAEIFFRELEKKSEKELVGNYKKYKDECVKHITKKKYLY